jgi:hypothetical protein
MFKIVFFLVFLCFFNNLANAKLKVAVIDTGLDLKYSFKANLCNSGHKDFTGEGFNDSNGHGTNIVGLIVDTAKTNNYCIILLKAYSNKKAYITEALQYAYTLNVNIINLSGGGVEPLKEERNIVLKLLDKNITIVTAAGNEKMDLDEQCSYYPACYDKRIYVIGNYSSYSNYGTIVDAKYNGNLKTGFGKTLSGTSQSTAIFTGNLLKTINNIKQGK